MLTCVNPLCGELPTGEPYAGDPHVRFGGRGDRDQTGLSYPYHFDGRQHFPRIMKCRLGVSDGVWLMP
jgi:hypothetical protein